MLREQVLSVDRMRLLYTWVWMFLVCMELADMCPNNCTCGWDALDSDTFVTNCSHLDFYEMPQGIPLSTHHLDMTHNRLQRILYEDLQNLTDLRVLDTRHNPELAEIKVSPALVNLTVIYTERGAICCQVELQWIKQLEGSVSVVCIATDPYTECHHNLLQIITLVMYGIIIPVSIVINPWVIIVTLSTTKRRREPFQLNYINFAIADLMITVYAIVMFGKGIAVYGSYPSHMDDWIQSAACSIIGYILITATFLLSFFYLISVIAVYQAVKYSLNTEKHLSMKDLNIALIISWLLSLLLAAIPFMTNKSYNEVGSCLPFYSSDYREYSYVILYTVVTTAGYITNTALGVIMLCIFASWRKVGNGDGHHGRKKENNAIQIMITSYMILHTVLTFVVTTLLVLSCVGGSNGMVGREWLIRVIVLESILWPLVGPMRRKIFYEETLRLMQKWNCYDWDKKRISLAVVSARRPTNPPSCHSI